MIIIAHHKAGDLPKDADVMVVRHAGIKTTKAGIKYVKENPGDFKGDKELEVIIPGQKFTVKETVQIDIIFGGKK